MTRWRLVTLCACLAGAACGARTGFERGVADAAVPDADASVQQDAALEGAPDAAEAASVCADPAPGPTPTCKYGTPSLECFTHEELVALAGTVPHDAAVLPFDPCGCLPPAFVADGCCIPAADGPFLDAGTCCYHFCVGPCC